MPFLGANRTALLAGWGAGEPAFTSRTTTTTTFIPGVAGYPYENYQGSYGRLANGGWTYDGTGASTAWGSFLAINMYIPAAVWTACETYGNGAGIGICRTDFADGTYSFTGTSYQFNYNGSTWSLQVGIQGSSFSTTVSKTALQDRWITVLISAYDTSANYASWTGGTPSGTLLVYNRARIYDTNSGDTLFSSDMSQGLSGGDATQFGIYKGYTSNVVNDNSRTGTQVSFQQQISNAFWPGSAPNPLTQIKVANLWFTMGGTLDPAAQYPNFAGFTKPNLSVSPWTYLPMSASGDWVSSGGNYYIDQGTGARITGGNENTSYDWVFFSNNYTPALTYI